LSHRRSARHGWCSSLRRAGKRDVSRQCRGAGGSFLRPSWKRLCVRQGRLRAERDEDFRSRGLHQYGLRRRVLRDAGRSLSVGRSALDLTYLARSLELWPVDAVQLHELRRKIHRFLPRAGFDDGIATDDLLGFGEWSVGDLELPARAADTRAFGGRFQAGRIEESALLQVLGDE